MRGIGQLMRWVRRLVLLLPLACFLAVQPSLAETLDPPILVVLGWMEEAVLTPGNFKVHAKLDTGADTSSLHAENLRVVKKKDKEWVQFEVTNRYGETAKFERRVRRYAEIKRKNGKSQRRPVIKLGVCVGDINEVVELTLVDRSNFSSVALIGRNFLSGKILVSASEGYTTDPSCRSE